MTHLSDSGKKYLAQPGDVAYEASKLPIPLTGWQKLCLELFGSQILQIIVRKENFQPDAKNAS